MLLVFTSISRKTTNISNLEHSRFIEFFFLLIRADIPLSHTEKSINKQDVDWLQLALYFDPDSAFFISERSLSLNNIINHLSSGSNRCTFYQSPFKDDVGHYYICSWFLVWPYFFWGDRTEERANHSSGFFHSRAVYFSERWWHVDIKVNIHSFILREAEVCVYVCIYFRIRRAPTEREHSPSGSDRAPPLGCKKVK